MKFRDKKLGWGALLNFTIQTKSGKIKHKYLTNKESYFFYYWGGNLYRPSCYSCKYACLTRKSDFTIGDFWGIDKNSVFNNGKGVSLILANTSKAEDILKLLKDTYLHLEKNSIEAATKENGQLTHPSIHKPEYDFLWDIYHAKGAKGLEMHYRRHHFKQIIIGRLRRHIPTYIVNTIKRLRQITFSHKYKH